MSETEATPHNGGKAPNNLTEFERRLLDRIRRHEPISRNVNQLHDQQLSFGERVADGLADVAGSWNFIITFLVLILIWVGVNSFLLIERPWDPYPFILLNLVLSLLAGLQAPVIMMSQNRQESKDRIRSEHDYEVNLKAELEIEQLHTKLDLLREKQWNDLVALQQRQIEMLEQQVTLLQGLRKD
ncbi:MAG TPA: DUF1003 domain-containing protein [Chloroflexota bacterium]